MPAEVEWIVKRDTTDLTSRSLREADATSEFLPSVPKRSPPYIPPHAGGTISPSPRAGRAGEGLNPRTGTPVMPVSEGRACHARGNQMD